MFYKYNNKLKEYARKNRMAGNQVEALLWNELKGKKLGKQFNRQRPIGDYIVDFLCKDAKLIVEIDGLSHENTVSYDQTREEYLTNLGYRVIHFSNTDILHNRRYVVEEIYHRITSPGSPSKGEAI